MSDIDYAIQIDLEDYSGTDTGIGLVNGVIRWITGTNNWGYSAPYPVWEDDSDNTYIWFDNFLTKNIGSPSRRIDIKAGGDYGTISGFSFEVRNTMPLWNHLLTNDISLANCDVTMYTVIDAKFYTTWFGVIMDHTYGELTATIKCETDYRKKHKTIPQSTISNVVFPNAEKSMQGRPIPVCIGDVSYAKLYSVGGKNTQIELGYDGDDNPLYYVAMSGYTEGSSITVISVRREFKVNELQGFYLHGVAGKNLETDKLIEITSNSASSYVTGSPFNYYATTLYISHSFDATESTVGSHNYFVVYEDNSEEVWWFEILSNDSRYLVSNNEVNDFIKNSYNQIILLSYNDDRKEMIDIHGIITGSIVRDRDYLELVRSDLKDDNKINSFTAYGCEWESKDYAGNDVTTYDLDTNPGRISDMDRSTSVDVLPISWHIGGAGRNEDIVFDLDLSTFDLRGIDELYIGFDCKITVEATTSGDHYVFFGFRLMLIDMFDQFVQGTNIQEQGDIGDIGGTPYMFRQDVNITSGNEADLDYNFLPSAYYKNSNDGGEASVFNGLDENGGQMRNHLKLKSDVLDHFRNGLASKIRIVFWSKCNVTPWMRHIYIKQIGVFSNFEIQTGEDNLCTRISGEEIDGSSNLSNSFYSGIYHILKNYDGLADADIEWNDTATTRAYNSSTKTGWNLGRQITEEKNSLEFLKELARYGMLGIYPQRDGKIAIKAWLEDSTLIRAFDESNIIKDSVKMIKETPIVNCYNEFKLWWGFNPGSDEFDKCININKVDASSDDFPAYYVDADGTAPVTISETVSAGYFDGVDSGHVVFATAPTVAVGEAFTFNFNTSGKYIYYAEVSKISGTTFYYKGVLDSNISIKFEFTSALVDTIYKHGVFYPLWMTYVEGIKDYALCKEMWDYCRESYNRTRIVKNYPELKCKWFVDDEVFNESTSVKETTSPILFLRDLMAWTTIQKGIVNIEVPITSDNIVLELLDYISYSDTILTLGGVKYGYITKIQINPKKNSMSLELTLKSALMYETDDLIIETGDAPDQIHESGSQPDTIEEGQQ